MAGTTTGRVVAAVQTVTKAVARVVRAPVTRAPRIGGLLDPLGPGPLAVLVALDTRRRPVGVVAVQGHLKVHVRIGRAEDPYHDSGVDLASLGVVADVRDVPGGAGLAWLVRMRVAALERLEVGAPDVDRLGVLVGELVQDGAPDGRHHGSVLLCRE